MKKKNKEEEEKEVRLRDTKTSGGQKIFFFLSICREKDLPRKMFDFKNRHFFNVLKIFILHDRGT